MIGEQVRGMWGRFHESFHDSEVIVWARLQYVLLGLYTALQSVDMTAFISDHRTLQAYIFINAFATEMLRRRREPFEG